MQETVTIKRADALNAFKIAKAMNSQDTVTLLKNLMPGVLGQITERIKTFEDACAELGIDGASVITTYDTPDEAAYKKLKVIVRALNEGWEPDWDNDNQYKYYPWFRRSSSPGFSFCDFARGLSHSCVGSRLCFKSRELCEYAAKQFKDIYSDFFN